MKRLLRNVAVLVAGGAIVGLASAYTPPVKPARSVAKPIAIKVYKSPTCGCCKSWIEHLKKNGFQVEAIDMPDLSAVKERYGVTQKLQSCHTAVVNGYVVEGHVPADVLLKFLKERPAVAGLTVPGMPATAPGMDGKTGEHYDVLTFDRAGHTKVYAHR
jgi:hypothetical protein